jgi:hypothetical protein
MSSNNKQSAEMKALMDAVTAVTSNDADAQAAAAAVAAFPFPPSSSGFVFPPAGMVSSAAIPSSASAATASVGGLPIRKRNHDEVDLSTDPFAISIKPPGAKRGRKIGSANCKDASVARARRLEQNRLAAIESRRRKKIMVEELQRSVGFYTKSNKSIKSQNAELERQILMARQKIIHGGDDGLDTVASTSVDSSKEAVNGNATSEKESSTKSDQPPSSSTATTIAKRASVGYAKDDYTSFKSPISSIDDEQAQQAQFAATQALYKSMGFPPGAARAAASTFSQYVSQTGNVPCATIHRNKSAKAEASEAAAAIASIPSADIASVDKEPKKQQLKPPPSYSLVAPIEVEPKASPKVDPNMAYIEALNKFAMEQAAAANSAAAAATAAIQAVNFHRQQMKGGSSASSVPLSSSVAFSPFLPGSSGFQFPSFPMPPQSSKEEMKK